MQLLLEADRLAYAVRHLWTGQLEYSIAYASMFSSMTEGQEDCTLDMTHMLAFKSTRGTYHVRIISRYVRSERPALLQRMAAQQALPQLHIHCLLTARLLVIACCLNNSPCC